MRTRKPTSSLSDDTLGERVGLGAQRSRAGWAEHEHFEPTRWRDHAGGLADGGRLRPSALVVHTSARAIAAVRQALAGHEVVVVNDGVQGLTAAIDGRPEVVLVGGDLPGISVPDLVAALRTVSETSHVPVLVVEAEGAPALRSDVERWSGTDVAGADPASIRAAVRTLVRPAAGPEGGSAGEASAPGARALSDGERAFLGAVFEAMEALHSDVSFGVADLADRLGVSPRQLRRRVQAAAGKPPSTLLRLFRLSRAAHLLAEGAPVKAVAYSVGFATPSGFRSAFRQTYGVPPSKFNAGASG